MEKSRVILSIDPSVNDTGWAVLVLKGEGVNQSREWKWGLIKPDGFNYVHKLFDIVAMLQLQTGFDEFDELVAEWPQFFNSGRGHVAAAQSYTINLAGICAFVAGRLQLESGQVFFRTAVDWKGSVSKAITMRRFLKHFGKTYYQVDHNTVDAIMLLHDHALRMKYIDALCDPAKEVTPPAT